MIKDAAHLAIAAVVLLIGGIALTAYLKTLLAHMTATANSIDKPVLLAGTSGLTWLNTKLMGWKTIILGWIAAGAQAISLLLASDLSPLKDIPWALVAEQRVANYITFAIALLIPVTHAMGLSKAAATPPTGD